MELNEKYVDYPDSSFYDIETSLKWFSKILSFNDIDESSFISSVASVMDKLQMKINAIWLYGSTNAGKSLLCNSIVESARFFANIMEFDERTAFPLNDAPGKRVILINEPVIADKRIELIKNVMEGQDTAINVKHKKGVTLPRTPLIISSNKKLWHYCPCEQQAILNRCEVFKMGTFDELSTCTKKLHPMMWKNLLNFHNPSDNYSKMLSALCSHRNWKFDYFSDISIAKDLFDSNAEVFSEQCENVHLSQKPSCSLCKISLKLMNLMDPPNDVSDCLSCGSKTVYLFCSECIHVLD